MDKIVDITKIIEKIKENHPQSVKNFVNKNATNPILKKLAAFSEQKLKNKFNIGDLLK